MKPRAAEGAGMMMPRPRGIKRSLAIAEKNVRKEIKNLGEAGGKFARGMASEGYAGGYLQALYDVELVLNGVRPSTNGWWLKEQG